MVSKELKPLVEPTVTFVLEDMCPLQTPYNDVLVIQLNIATIIVNQIFVDIGSSINFITFEFLKKL